MGFYLYIKRNYTKIQPYLLHATSPPALAADDAVSIASRDEVGIDNWNGVEDNYGFVYSNPDRFPESVVVKCLAINEKLFVDAVKKGEYEQTLHLELDVGDYVGEDGGRNYSSQLKNLGKLVENVNNEILNRVDDSGSRIGADEPPYEGYIVPPLPGGRGGGGMVVGRDDPRFFPVAGAPRFDPFGPPGVAGFEPRRFGRNPPTPHPDLDHIHDAHDFLG